MRVAVAVALFASVSGVVAMIALPSCSDIPSKTCFADRLNRRLPAPASFDAGDDPLVDCTQCLQTKDAPRACCDAVGACQDDPTQDCENEFTAAHNCVIAGGPGEESQCKGYLQHDKSRALYACMRSTCATECRVPSCDIDPAVILFANPTCDRCMGGSCCAEINSCYQSRRCKLSLECIINNCGDTLGESMTLLGALGEETLQPAEAAICQGRGPGPGAGGAGITACIQNCIGDFTGENDASTTVDDVEAQCLAFKVYTCGARKNCGARCVPAAADAATD